MTPQEQREKALDQIRAVYNDGEAEINGRIYKFHRMQHVERRKVFAFYTSVQSQINQGNFSFLDTPQFAATEDVMSKNISFDGVTLDKARDHWDEYPEDYIQLVATALGVISFPFIRAAGIASASQAGAQALSTSAKPM